MKKKLKKLFNSLTKTQKLAIIFLICCLKTGKIPLIQGQTSSGKSYLIKVFAEILGNNPILCQVSNPRIILGENIIRDISIEEKNILKNTFNNIKDLIDEKRKFIEIKQVEYHSILSKILSTLNHKKDKQKKKKPLNHEQIKLLDNAKNIFTEILNLKAHISHQDSVLISAIKKGEWVFFDGIEMGYPILFEKIQSLCYENHLLKIIDDYFLNKESISPEFKLILTINPTNFDKKYTNQRLFMICPIFSFTSSISNVTNLNNKDILQIKIDNPLILNLSRNNIEDIEIFDKNIFKQLRFLILEENQITKFGSINCLKTFTELEYLVLSKNKIKEIKSLADIKFDNLSYLSLSHNMINDISTLSFSNLSSIKVLDLSFNQITNINSFEKVNFPILEDLYLNNNKINDISTLQKTNFQVLKKLDLKNNYIKEIEVLEKVNYENLEILNLESNEIIDINVFIKVIFINSLKELYLINNPIKYYDLLNLCYFPSLNKINLSKNDELLQILSIKLRLYGYKMNNINTNRKVSILIAPFQLKTKSIESCDYKNTFKIITKKNAQFKDIKHFFLKEVLEMKEQEEIENDNYIILDKNNENIDNYTIFFYSDKKNIIKEKIKLNNYYLIKEYNKIYEKTNKYEKLPKYTISEKYKEYNFNLNCKQKNIKVNEYKNMYINEYEHKELFTDFLKRNDYYNNFPIIFIDSQYYNGFLKFLEKSSKYKKYNNKEAFKKLLISSDLKNNNKHSKKESIIVAEIIENAYINFYSIENIIDIINSIKLLSKGVYKELKMDYKQLINDWILTIFDLLAECLLFVLKINTSYCICPVCNAPLIYIDTTDTYENINNGKNKNNLEKDMTLGKSMKICNNFLKIIFNNYNNYMPIDLKKTYFGDKPPSNIHIPANPPRDENKFINVIYHDENCEKYLEDVYDDSRKFRKITNGTFIYSNSMESFTTIINDIKKKMMIIYLF